MSDFVCKICTRSQKTNHPRHGGICCNACATFFSRSIYAERSYVCYNQNDCLKDPSKWGICCRKCRFTKCMEIGMPIMKVKLPYLRITYHEAQTYAQIIDALLVTCISNPEKLKIYLKGEDETIFNISHETFNRSITKPITQRANLLTSLMAKYPINSAEGLPALCFICVCRLKFSWYSEEQQTKITQIQNDAFHKLEREKLNISYVFQLIELAKQCLNIFNTFIYTN